MRRRDFVTVSAVVCLIAVASQALAQSWPQQAIHFIISFGAGAGADIVGRILADAMQNRLGQPVVVENKPGAGGILGNELVASATFLIVTRPDFPANSVVELVAAARAAPGKIILASPGFAATQHFAGELFKLRAEVNLLHVPFRSSPEAINAVLGKHADVLFDTVSALIGQVQSGTLKALAVTGKDRFPAVPDIPAAAESSVLPGYDVTTWYGVFGPPGVPAAVVETLNKTLNDIIA